MLADTNNVEGYCRWRAVCSDAATFSSVRRRGASSGPARSPMPFGPLELFGRDRQTRQRDGERARQGVTWRPFHQRFPLATGSRGSRLAPWALRARSQRRLSRSDRSWLAGILASPAQGRLDPKAIIHAQTLRRRRRTLSWVQNNAAAKTELPRREQTANWPFASSQKILRWELSDRQVLHNFARLWMPVFWDSPQCIRLAGEG